jgi:hypothetical protein
MERDRVNVLSRGAMALLSVVALGTVLTGYATGARTGGDEGALAHVFQLAVLTQLPVGLVFLSTGDWSQGRKIVGRLAVPALLLVVAFVALYRLEHR